MGLWPKFGKARKAEPKQNLSEQTNINKKSKKSSWEQTTKTLRSIGQWLIFILFLGIVIYMLRPSKPIGMEEYQVGTPSASEVISPFDFKVYDEQGSRQAQEKEADKVLPLFRYNSDISRDILLTIDDLWKTVEEVRSKNEIPLEESAEILSETHSVKLPSDIWLKLLRNYKYHLIRDTLKIHLETTIQDGIVRNSNEYDIIQNSLEYGIYIRDGSRERRRISLSNIRDVSKAISHIESQLERDFPKPEDSEALNLGVELAEVLLIPNLMYLEDVTNARKEEARDNTPDVYFEIQRNESIVRAHEIITPVTKAKLDELYSIRAKSWLGQILGLIGILYIILLSAWIFIKRYQPDILENFRSLLSISIIFLSSLVMAKVAHEISGLRTIYSQLGYIIPVAGGGILVGTLFRGRIGLFFVTVVSLLMGFILGWDIRYIFVGFFSGFIGVYSVASIRKRSDLYKTGLYIALISAGLIIGIYLIENPTLEDIWNNKSMILFALLWGALNGVLSTGIAVTFLPVFEDILGIATDIKLLELSIKTPVLRRLEEEAPGTYLHSLSVAALAEAAAESIGANPLLCRVGALYHDIGKISKPMYFAENQSSQADKMRHTQLTPNMSVRLIRNHVKEGLDLAIEYKLPKIIADFIPQHHGTTLLTYFYGQALSEDDKDSVQEENYRYPGPKPQIVESAILMLADSIEAASRTLPFNSKEGEIKQFVRKIINEKFMDGQFDECYLTLRDLHRLSESFAKSVKNQMHQRVEYPKIPQPVNPERAAKGLVKPEAQNNAD